MAGSPGLPGQEGQKGEKVSSERVRVLYAAYLSNSARLIRREKGCKKYLEGHKV